MLRKYLRCLPACLYFRLVRKHCAVMRIQGIDFLFDGDVLVRVKEGRNG
jgi:hypothetical protein